jgi:hypothetical protein
MRAVNRGRIKVLVEASTSDPADAWQSMMRIKEEV